VPHLYPADLPLPRERSKQPYNPAEIADYLALADAQPTTQRRMRATALVCLDAGAGLIRSDLRDARHRPRAWFMDSAGSELASVMSGPLSSTRRAQIIWLCAHLGRHRQASVAVQIGGYACGLPR